MTRRMVEITFNGAMRQASQIEACADDMMRLSRNDMASIKNDISAAWQGSSASAYLSKVDISAQNIVTTAGRLYQIAETLRSVARRFRDAELRAIELAERRDH